MHDHRKLGRELELFGTDPQIGAGLPYWLPAGADLKRAVEEFVRDRERRAGYRHVSSPVLGKRELYERSGHEQHYRDDMFPPMRVGGEELVLRPSLCPHHAVLYRSRSRSYRELPVRLAELGAMFRAERSGVVSGLTRVRSIQLNDGHVFCALDQVAGEVRACLSLIREAYAAMGIEASAYRLSLPGVGDKFVADAAMWQRANAVLRQVLVESGVDFEVAEGEAAFYGPKIDVQVRDGADREWTLSTVQVDFHQPRRFDLQYVGADGAHHRPVMVHRAIVGSIERMVAHLLEVHGGALPPWLAPVQVVVLPVSESEASAAHRFVDRCVRAGLRAEVSEEGTLGARIRAARLVPYQAVLGPKEAVDETVAVRLRDGRKLDPMPAGDFVNAAASLTGEHEVRLWP